MSTAVITKRLAMEVEQPQFVQFVRQVARLRREQLEACLELQARTGERLEDILRREEMLSREQTKQVLRIQARWLATAMHADLEPNGLPYPSFLSLCMPAYNERENIEDTLDAACAILPEFVRDFELVVVDDGSKDATGDLVARYIESEPRIRLVRHETNRGYGAAVTSGLRAARGDLVAFIDSDGQFSLLDLPHLLARLDGNDVVIGYRYQRADPWIRTLNAWAWNQLIRAVLGVRVRDLDCAFKLFRREVVDRLQLTSEGATINAEIMVQCTRGGLRISEIPVNHYPRYHGTPSGAALGVIAKAFRELPRLWRYRTASMAPDDLVNAEGCSGNGARPQLLSSEPGP